MSKRTLILVSISIIFVLLVAGLWALTAYYNDLPDHISQHTTLVFGQNRLVPGSQAAMRVVVRDSKDGSPLPDSEIKVSLRSSSGGRALVVYSGQADSQGTANVTFTVPTEAESNQNLIVETSSSLGSDKVERPVTLVRDYRLLLSTDKPIYQPGQVIHLRGLALSTFDLTPAANQELEIIIADGKGNKVFRQKLTTSEFGVASTDFQLADEVNTGAYKISATMGDTASEKTVTVEHYVLPKFGIDLETERDFYMPGEHVRGALSANYFFGKPVASGEVSLEGYVFDVERIVAVNIQGTTDTEGNYDFEFDLPTYVAGSDLEGGLGRFYLQASITDLTQHTETSNMSLPVSAASLVIEAIPEGGQFRTNVENILYILVSYPDGAPAEAALTVKDIDSGEVTQVETGAYGLAEVRFTSITPWKSFRIQARDVLGSIAEREFYLEGIHAEESVLLRPEQPVYRVGNPMHLDIYTSQPNGTVYLDIVREGQTISTRAVDVEEGRAELVVDLTPDLFGTLELHAYKILRSGTITRDTRLVVVDNAEDLLIALSPGQGTYRPGDPATIDVQVSGQDGIGAQAALGIAIVDESVFALAEQDPGFAKLYFLLEQELLVPKYDLHGFSVPDLVTGVPIDDPQLETAVRDTASASLASAIPVGELFSLKINSHMDAMQNAAEIRALYFTRVTKGLFALFLLFPLAAIGLSVYSLWRQKNLWRSLALSIGLVLFLTMLLFIWPVGDNHWWVQTPMDRLSLFFEWIVDDTPLLSLGILLLGLLSYLALIVITVRRKDLTLGLMLVVPPIFVLNLTFLVYAGSQATLSPPESILIWSLAALLMLPLAFLLRAAGFTWERRFPAALSALLASLLILVTAVGSLAFAGSPTRGMQQAAMMEIGDGAVFLEAEMGIDAIAPNAMAFGGEVKKEADLAANKASPEEAATTGEPPRLRQYFPETMLWLPDAVTEPDGSLSLDFDVADSITTWRVTALASSQDGRLGSTTSGLRVFQDFFIDLDLPLALTVGDEVAIPVGVFNYLPEAQDVRLELEGMDWFELLDEPIKEINIASNDITVVYFRVRATRFGRQPFKVTAWGSQMSDAIQKEVRVFPDGKPINFTQSDRLEAGTPIQQTVNIPPEAIPGTQSLVVKIYPGIVSQVVEGLDSILRMPNGCFEQTSSSTYPNVLVLDYLKSTEQASPETQMKAEEYINLGYQRLTTFEVGSTGGFSLFGGPPADRMLTAYGLQEFADMSRVHDVDPALVERAASWLLSQQAGDGSWENDRGLVHENTWSSLGDDRLPVTAYIAWSLVDAGFGTESGTQQGIAYVRERQSQAEDPYEAALVANALVAADLTAEGKLTPATQAALDRLAEMAVSDGSTAYWPSGVATFMGSEGQTGSIETTALAALAFLRSGTHPDLGNAALTYLVQQKDSFGTWYSTQATVLALKALIQSVIAGAENVDATVTVSLNNGQTRTVNVTPENFDVVQLISFDDILPGADNQVEINVEGEGNLMYQVSGGYYLPWDSLALYPDLAASQEMVTIDVTYDRTELAVNDTVEVDVTLTLNEEGGLAESALIDLGLPPGFSVEAEDLAALVTRFNDVPEDYAFPTIERYELTGRQILIYVSNLSYGSPLQFTYRLRAKFPLLAQTPASNAYDYYNPEVAGEAAPQTLVVNP